MTNSEQGFRKADLVYGVFDALVMMGYLYIGLRAEKASIWLFLATFMAWAGARYVLYSRGSAPPLPWDLRGWKAYTGGDAS